MTAYGTVAQAVAAMREGATDYIVKPFDAPALIEMARRQLSARALSSEMVAVDPESKRTVALARKIAENDATVLITGESGTGKEVYARFIRDHSSRAGKPFVAINCAAIPENMLEATLFGYDKGPSRAPRRPRGQIRTGAGRHAAAGRNLGDGPGSSG